jgi:hypothetical protein
VVTFANEHEEPDHYLGTLGDFRNEACVNDLVLELGIDALPDLDNKAAELLTLCSDRLPVRKWD